MSKQQQRQLTPAQQKTKALQNYLKQGQLAQWASHGVDPRSLIRFACMEYQNSQQLQKCKPETIYLALIACAQVGLEPSSVKGEAYIVPYGSVATFVPGYKGLCKLAMRSGLLKSIGAEVVYEHDHFDLQLGPNADVEHRPALDDRGKIVGAYAYAVLTTGATRVEWMSITDLEKIRKSSKSGNSPAYKDWASEMYRKAPIRRLCKTLPLGSDFLQAVHLDAKIEGGDVTGYRQAIDPLGEVEGIDTSGAIDVESTEAPKQEEQPGDLASAVAEA